MYRGYDKKDEDSYRDNNPFSSLDKASVAQESRIFNATPIQPRRCCFVLSKILYIIYQGDVFSTKEATSAFFAMTRLFQHKDSSMRKLVYLTIKELAPMAEDVIIVTSSLTKDMTGKEDSYRASAIRALCSVTDATMIQAIERYLKQSIVDRNPAVASAALVSSVHLLEQKATFDVVKRWSNEVQEAIQNKNIMVQYHALGLLYKLKEKDRLAVSKLVQKLMHGSIRSSYATCMLIRFVKKCMEDDTDPSARRTFYDYLEISLRHKSEMVIYEAARAICTLDEVTPRELQPAISVLQLFLSSPKPTLRFAAIRNLSNIAISHPLAVTPCNLDMENLITDQNRSIATLAITTLLKTGSESTVDRLMKQISGFMSEISDEFKVVVVDAIRALCLKFPSKQVLMMAFLSSVLRDEGGFEYKKAIVDTLVDIISEIPEARESGLTHMCEFIEDCEFQSLSTHVLHILGEEGPSMPNPARFIRYIYNRVILENSSVRAAAVSALAKFGVKCDKLTDSIVILLSRCQYDDDDEVRDRATFYLDMLTKEKTLAKKLILDDLSVSLPGLERKLMEYIETPGENAFDLKSVPILSNVSASTPRNGSNGAGAGGVVGGKNSMEKRPMNKSELNKKSQQEVYSEELAKIPEFSSYGPLFKSSASVPLTESETEYVVTCVKHLFNDHIVLQFNCRNTLNDQRLQDVSVQVETDDDFAIVTQINIPVLAFDDPQVAYVAMSLPEDPTEVAGTFSNTLKFVVLDCDPDTGEPDDDQGYDDEYEMEELDLATADHVLPVNISNFGESWEEVGEEAEVTDVFELSAMKSLEDAVESIIGFLGMYPCDRTDKVPDGANTHTLELAGFFRGSHKTLVKARLAFQYGSGVTMQLAVRSVNETVAEILAASIG